MKQFIAMLLNICRRVSGEVYEDIVEMVSVAFDAGYREGRDAEAKERAKDVVPGPVFGIPLERIAGILHELYEGRKIGAIRLMREQTGLGLKEAKDAVEEIARFLDGYDVDGMKLPGYFPPH